MKIASGMFWFVAPLTAVFVFPIFAGAGLIVYSLSVHSGPNDWLVVLLGILTTVSFFAVWVKYVCAPVTDWRIRRSSR